MAEPTDVALARALNTAPLEQVVPTLPAVTLHRLINRVGLDACAGVVALATPDQIRAVFDLDVWRPPMAGAPEALDVARIIEWIEALTDADVVVAAATFAALDPTMVAAALTRYVRVFDPIAVTPYMTLDGERVEPAPASVTRATATIGGYVIGGRIFHGWDALTTLLRAMEAEVPDAFRAVMDVARRLSDRGREADGLDDLADHHAQALFDAGTRRAERQVTLGYVEVDDARAFLLAARQRSPDSRGCVDDPVVRCYLGDLVDGPAGRLPDGRNAVRRAPASLDRVLVGGRPRGQAAAVLSFLANTLVAGCSFQADAFEPAAAAAAVTATCHLGLDSMGASGTSPGELAPGDAMAAFACGWSILHRDVGLYAARTLGDILESTSGGDTRTHVRLLQLRRELARHLQAGTPWRVHDALDVLSTLDVLAWRGLLGVLDECPHLPAVVDAVLDRRVGAVSATDYTFIATMRQVARAQAFVDRVPDLLSG